MGCTATSTSNQKVNGVHKTTEQCKRAKRNYSLGAATACLMSMERAGKQGLYALQLLAEKLLHAVRVPLEDAQLFCNVPVVVQQL